MITRSVAATILLILAPISFGDQPASANLTTDKITEALGAINQVATGGQGHDEAVAAMRILNKASPDQIPLILNAMSDENPLAVNWLRSAVISIAGDGSKLPYSKIRGYFDDLSNSHLGRLLAFELLTENKTELASELIPGLVDDPSLPLRYMAIDDMIRKSEEADEMKSIGMLGFAMEKARNVDQVVKIAKALNEKGVSVDLQKQLGFLNSWNLVGNFDNQDEVGFDVAYGPEKDLENFDLENVYDDATQADAAWKPHNTVDPTGLVDLNKVVGKTKGVIVYAHTSYDSDVEQQVDIRIGCINAHKIWVNGELVMSNEIYHNGISPDKFSATANLKKGKNDILIKVCQNEQTEPWAQRWQFQVRICDESGKAIRPTKKEVRSEG